MILLSLNGRERLIWLLMIILTFYQRMLEETCFFLSKTSKSRKDIYNVLGLAKDSVVGQFQLTKMFHMEINQINIKLRCLQNRLVSNSEGIIENGFGVNGYF